MNNNQSHFLYNSIQDIQNTIRLVDAKLGFLLAILGFAVPNIGKITIAIKRISSLLTNYDILYLVYIFVICCFALSLSLSFYIALVGISSIDNPAKHIAVSGAPATGAFYRGGLFPIKLYDVVYNRPSLVSNITLNSCLHATPISEEEIVSELTFEQLKLCYIRDIKIKRQSTAYVLALLGTLFGFLAWSPVLFL